MVCFPEQLEAFKKHMEAGETNTPAIIMGEEDDAENGPTSPPALKGGETRPEWQTVSSVCPGEKDGEEKDLNSEAPSSLSEMTSEIQTNSVSLKETVGSKKEEEQSNSIKKVKLHKHLKTLIFQVRWSQ